MKEVMLAVEDPEKKTHGLYWVLATDKKNKDEKDKYVFYKKEPEARAGMIEEGETAETPRHIRCLDGTIHVFTKRLHTELKRAIEIHRSGRNGSRKKVRAVIKPIAESILRDTLQLHTGPNPHFLNLVDDKNTSLYSLPWNNGMLLSLCCADPLHTELKPGPLFYFPNTDLKNAAVDSIELIAVNATGPMAVEGNRLAFASRKRLERMIWGTDIHGRGSWNPPQSPPLILSGEVLAVDCLDGIVVCTDNREGYVITKGIWDSGEMYQKVKLGAAETAYFKDNFSGEQKRSFLPSEATSALLIKWRVKDEEKKYLLFGVDLGRILLYGLEEKNGEVVPHYLKTVSFLTDNTLVYEANKDNHVRNLRNDGGKGFISATLRNLYLEVRFDKLLSYDKDNPPEQDEQDEQDSMDKNKIKYLKEMKAHYSLERICMVPHRILDYDFISSNGNA